MSNLNGKAAEVLMAKVLGELGISVKCPVSTDRILAATKGDKRGAKHYASAKYHVVEDFGSLNVSADLLADRMLGSDGFFEANDGTVMSYDVTVNTKGDTVSKKLGVQRTVKGARSTLGLNGHVLVVLQSSTPYTKLTYDQKWSIVDSLLEAAEDNEDVVYINV